MRAIKISLFIVAISTIGFFLIKSLVSTEGVRDIPLAENATTRRIEQEILLLGQLPNGKFCKDEYNHVKYLIDDAFKPHPPQHSFGRLGNTQLENDQQKENLIRKLYAAYADKFLLQVIYVFQGTEWDVKNLQFIRNECITLKKSTLLGKNSPVDKKFSEILTAIDKYYEIAGFISGCKGFRPLATGFADQFPISDVQAKISAASAYRSNNLGNRYVNNCTRLHAGLKEVPQILFKSHIGFLDNKIDQWSGKFGNGNYISHTDYVDKLNKPLASEIDALDNSIYQAPNFEGEQVRLSQKWNDDNSSAYNHTY